MQCRVCVHACESEREGERRLHLFCVGCFPCHCQAPLRNVRVPFCQSRSQSAKMHTHRAHTEKVTLSFAQPLITHRNPSCHCSSPWPSLTHLLVPPSLSPYLLVLLSTPRYLLLHPCSSSLQLSFHPSPGPYNLSIFFYSGLLSPHAKLLRFMIISY